MIPSLEEQLVNKLIEKNRHISCAESCTGGLVASRIVNVANASKVFDASFVTYANEAKIKYLGVSPETIVKYGVVSEEVAFEMAAGVAKETGSEVGIAVSGIAGPGGGTRQKPVGTVWIAIATPNGSYAVMRNSGTDRSQIISRASAYAIEMLYDEVKNM